MIREVDGDVAQSDDRWVEVSKSAFAHETDGLAMLGYLLPKASPFRAWTNFEFMGNYGQSREIAGPVLNWYRLHPVKLEHHAGVLERTKAKWVRATPAVCVTDGVDVGTALGEMTQIG